MLAVSVVTSFAAAAEPVQLAQLGLDRLGLPRERPAPIVDGVAFAILFPGAARGLAEGAAVEINGVRIGAVRRVVLDYDPARNRFVVATEIELQPSLIPGPSGRPRNAAEALAAVDALVRAGLRAQLGNTRLVGGETVVALDIRPEAPPATLGRSGPVPEIPVGVSRQEVAAELLDEFLQKLARAPVEEMIGDVQQAMAALRALATGPELRDTLAALRDGATELRTQAAQLGGKADPILLSLNESVRAANRTIDRATQTLATVERQVGDRSPLMAEVNGMVRELGGAARALRLMADYLERNPDALIRGKSDSRR